jgi:hypothetical protein
VIWEPFILALVLGIIVSAGLYFAYLWPSVEPVEDNPAATSPASPPAEAVATAEPVAAMETAAPAEAVAPVEVVAAAEAVAPAGTDPAAEPDAAAGPTS